jgi:carbon storage regulator
MLVLSRKLGESIVVADSIVVTVLEVKRGVVRLGVEAPRAVRVLRQELTDGSGQAPEVREVTAAGG